MSVREPSDPPAISIVIPTYNRGPELRTMIDSLLAAKLPDRSEVIVVDDGSAVPAAVALQSIAPPDGVTLRLVTQANAGVGAARNRGFAAAAADIVLFIDDDMVVLPDTIARHLDAQQRYPGGVIFGRSPYIEQKHAGPFVRWVLGLPGDPYTAMDPELIDVPIVASGHLGVDRRGPLSEWEAFYADDMRTPVAEEYELSARLMKLGVPIRVGRDIVALHNRQIGVTSFLRQQRSHGRGCAEAIAAHPETLQLEPLLAVQERFGRGYRGVIRRVAATPPAAALLARLAAVADRRSLPRSDRLFRAASGAAFALGFHEGRRAARRR